MTALDFNYKSLPDIILNTELRLLCLCWAFKDEKEMRDASTLGPSIYLNSNLGGAYTSANDRHYVVEATNISHLRCPINIGSFQDVEHKLRLNRE